MRLETYPAQVLRQACTDVVIFGQELRHLVDDMAELMYVSDGVGLAAPQVGISQRLVLVDPSAGEVGDQLLVMVNPVVTWTSDELTVDLEGCLSLPGIRLPIKRPIACDVEYLAVDGTHTRLRCTDWQARIVQHELDHLVGTLMFDQVGPLARQMALKKLALSG